MRSGPTISQAVRPFAKLAALALSLIACGGGLGDALEGLANPQAARLDDARGDTVVFSFEGGDVGREHDPRADITALEARVEGTTLLVTLALAGDPNVWPGAEDDIPAYQVLVQRDDDPLGNHVHLSVDYDASAWRFGFSAPNEDVRYTATGFELGPNSVTMRIPLGEMGFPMHIRLYAVSNVCDHSGAICERDELPTRPEEFAPPDDTWLSLSIREGG